MNNKLLAEKLDNAVAITSEGEDGSIYLATVCSVLDLATLAKHYPDSEIVRDAVTYQTVLANRWKVV